MIAERGLRNAEWETGQGRVTGRVGLIGLIGLVLLASTLVPLASAAAPATADNPATEFSIERAPWPFYRGPYHNGIAPEKGIKLVDDWSKARHVWTSDVQVPGSYISAGGVNYWTGGFGNCIVAEDRVYVHYCTPPGRTTFEFTPEDMKYHRKNNRLPKYPELLVADDVVHCFDTKTGKTLWRTVFEGKGGLYGAEMPDARMSCTWYDGRVYAPGSGAYFYCVDAKTGELVWEKQVVYGRKLKTKTLPADRAMTWGGGGAEVPCGVAGVVLFKGKAYDAATGEEKWSLSQDDTYKPDRYESAIVWKRDGTWYFYQGGCLIEALTGKVCWSLYKDHPDWNLLNVGTSATIYGDLLTFNSVYGTGQRREARDAIAAHGSPVFRISTEKYELLWSNSIMHEHNQCALVYEGRIYSNRGHTGEYGQATARKGDPKTKDWGVYVYDIETGEVWASLPALGRGTDKRFWGYMPYAVEGKIICGGSGAGMLMSNARDKENLWTRSHLKEVAHSNIPAYADGFVYFRTQMSTGRDVPKAGDGEFSRIKCYDLRAEPEKE